MEKKSYVDMMIDSLKKKIILLEKISEFNDMQKQVITADSFDADDFDGLVEEKNKLIMEINKLDDGFETIYDRIRDELQQNKAVYAGEIQVMQECIGRIVGLTSSIEAEEKRIKAEVEKQFSKLKQNIKETRKNSAAVSSYYKSMSKVDTEPQFMDRKK
ncbi:MAG: hypothetical protein NC086_09400 [Alistipes sp.]|nr:hypothetical protein [Alistipes sp.]